MIESLTIYDWKVLKASLEGVVDRYRGKLSKSLLDVLRYQYRHGWLNPKSRRSMLTISASRSGTKTDYRPKKECCWHSQREIKKSWSFRDVGGARTADNPQDNYSCSIAHYNAALVAASYLLSSLWSSSRITCATGGQMPSHKTMELRMNMSQRMIYIKIHSNYWNELYRRRKNKKDTRML